MITKKRPKRFNPQRNRLGGRKMTKKKAHHEEPEAEETLPPDPEKLIEEAVKAEREECARIAEYQGAGQVAHAIRARTT